MKNVFMLLLSTLVLAALVATLGLFLRRLQSIETERWGAESAQKTLRQITRILQARWKNRNSTRSTPDTAPAP